MSDQPKVGRPSLLTAETRGRLLGALREGVHREAACEFAGISYSTFARWLRLGRVDEVGEFYELGLEVREAEASMELQVLEQVRRDLPGDPKAALLLLARRFPRRWGPRVNVTIERELTNFLNRVQARLSPELFRIVLDESIAAVEAEPDDEPTAVLLAPGKLPQ